MKHLAGLASALGALLVAVLVTLTAAAVFMRYVMGAPISWTEEVSAILMIWIIMLGAISCEWHRQHLTIDFAVAWLPRPGRRWLGVAVALLSVAVLLTMAWLAWGLAQGAGFKRTQILGVSWFWMNLAVVVGALGASAVTLWRMVLPARDPLDPALEDDLS
ncbi:MULTISPECIES: TRAP transporter small permease [Paracoccus]|uniref:TRAP transporter small permease n=1 Tax=Paracoccus TaxID=265 RepID=UPI00086B950F|nr:MULTISPECIES: TRAP transporter small permease [Paracoccus]ODT60413.1 MAG: C4-dicarboxylate ABC transporter permease [Paracoccus sp. SCN 68-21]